MTVRCGGGTSSGRDSFSRFVYVGPSQLGALLNNIPTPWAVYFAGAIGSLQYDLSTFCTVDPPADPGMTAADWAALINPYTLSSSVLAQSKFRDWLGHYLWDTFCKCDSGTIPTPFTPPTAPADLPQLNSPLIGPTYPTGQACLVYNGSFHVTTPNIPDHAFLDPVAVPAGATSVSMVQVPSRHATVTGEDWQLILNALNSAGTFISSPVFSGETAGSAPSGTPTANLPSGTAFIRWAINAHHFAVDTDFDVSASVYCGSSLSPTTPQPCPTDPFTQIQLDQLLKLVTLIQRQAVPFAYVASTSHSGLTGSGHLDVADLLGVKVQLDSYGSAVGVESGDPAEFFEAGWITWSNADGATKREWITHSPFVSLPAVAGQFTRIGYTLGQGVSATITELVREP